MKVWPVFKLYIACQLGTISFDDYVPPGWFDCELCPCGRIRTTVTTNINLNNYALYVKYMFLVEGLYPRAVLFMWFNFET